MKFSKTSAIVICKAEKMRKISKKNVLVICTFVIVKIFFVRFILSLYFRANTMKYVLIWSHPSKGPFALMVPGNKLFQDKKCPVQNCYISVASDKKLLKKVSNFDAILFHGPATVKMKPNKFLPKIRSANQSYIFASMESSHNYKVPDTRLDDVFNFTWTYKLNSDISLKYMVIRDCDGKVIGPNATVNWISIDDMQPINEDVKAKLANKSVAACWIVSHCQTNSKREILASRIAKEMKKFNMTLDIYGACGSRYFSSQYLKLCLQILQRNYYFYFAFENSFSEDYVTEKLRNALQNYAVPIVYGGADYKRFMPDGIYLNAKTLSVKNLVKKMAELINDKEKYYDFFKWHNHYSYHDPEETPDTDPYCSLCSFINNVNLSKVSTIKQFYEWWSPRH